VKRIAFVAMATALSCAELQAQTPSVAADYSYSPITPGAWTYRAVAGGSEASFVDGAGVTRMVATCGKVTRLVTLARISAAPAATLSFWTSSAMRDLPARFDVNSKRVVAQVGASDALLDALVFSRGRFAVSMPGFPALVVPAGTEVAHVVEDCRG
jgi:hypothetical protein